MAARTSSRRQTFKMDRMVTLWLYPRLQEMPPETWGSMLAKARNTDFNTYEWVVIVGGVSLVAWLLGIGIPEVSLAPYIVHLLRFVLALPLLAAIVGPAYLRRTRRGLDRELARVRSRDAGTQSHFSVGKEK